MTYHSSGRVNDLHLLKDSGAIVSDQNFALWCLDLLTVSHSKLRQDVWQRVWFPFWGVMKECANGTFWTYHFIHASGSERGANDVSDGYKEKHKVRRMVWKRVKWPYPWRRWCWSDGCPWTFQTWSRRRHHRIWRRQLDFQTFEFRKFNCIIEQSPWSILMICQFDFPKSAVSPQSSQIKRIGNEWLIYLSKNSRMESKLIN